ncbi:histidine phosphatase family protein [Limimaricola hongkongensis]|uniref:Phosphoglycerate mutase n=1 Tax=Limimaricola hongkongensis DSM 17492 TaxID=1122180 RepID=A0A017HDE7_9RHOB|nr:histidine phosphatase family protein [Limimaricola hongkongensis]EYD72391.1 phosphoglycerate mutase [Limimaricola hongkongensis DSM 17492]
MRLPEIYVLRHGETEWNRARRMQGGFDSQLTETGRAQARAMGRMLAARGVDAASHRLLSSPQGRAVETARLAFGVAPEPDPRLREIAMGDWSGLERAEIDARWPGPPGEHFIDFYARAPNGEGFAALWARCADLLADLDRPAILVTHGMTSRVLRTIATGGTRADLARLPGGQGVVFRLKQGRHERLVAPLAAGQAGR